MHRQLHYLNYRQQALRHWSAHWRRSEAGLVIANQDRLSARRVAKSTLQVRSAGRELVAAMSTPIWYYQSPLPYAAHDEQ